MDRARLKAFLENAFGVKELEQLVDDRLGDLKGHIRWQETLAVVVLDLVVTAEQRGRMDELRAALLEARPHRGADIEAAWFGGGADGRRAHDGGLPLIWVWLLLALVLLGIAASGIVLFVLVP